MEGDPSKPKLKECSSHGQGSVDTRDSTLRIKEDNSVRLLVQEEGRAARNLIAFSVPCDMVQVDSSKVSRKPPSSPRTVQETKKEDAPPRITKRAPDTSTPGSRVRSASTGRDKKSELQARYWAFLFGNLQRAVDEIYQTCETDESVSECKEVILVLENFTKDFHNLIEWFLLKWEYEKTPPPQRPNSLAWEVRKSSPGKIQPHVLPTFSSPVRRILHFCDVIDKERPRPSGDKISDSIKTGKCSPVIPPVVEDQEVTSFEPVESFANANQTPETISKNTDKDQVSAGKKETKEVTIQSNEAEPSIRDLTKEINSENEKNISKIAETVLVSNASGERCISAEVLLCSSSEALPPGMTSQACQTDPEQEDTVADPGSNPTMVDKGVGTTAKPLTMSRSTIGAPGRAPSALAIANMNRTAVSASSPSTFAGAATKTPMASARNLPGAVAKGTSVPLKSAPPSINLNTKSALINGNGPSGSTPTSNAASAKPYPNSGSSVLKSSSSAIVATSVSTTPKTSLAAIVTKPSTASVVKRNAARPSSCVSSTVNGNQTQVKPSGPPKMQRSRTVTEVSRPNRPSHSNRPGVSRQFNHSSDQSSGTSSIAVAPRKEKTKHFQNVISQEGNKKPESGDDSGWETVKNRSRWRLNCNYNPKHRFNKPTCAVSLPALIIVDDEEEPTVSKNPVCKQNSQDVSLRRRHSEKMEPLSPDNVKSKKCIKPKAIDTTMKPEKTVNGSSKQSIGKNTGKVLKRDNRDVSSKPKLEGSGAVKTAKCAQDTSSTVTSAGKENKQVFGKSSSKDKDDKSQSKKHDCDWKSVNGNKPIDLEIDNALSEDESSSGPRTSSTATPTTMTPTTTPATPTTPTNSASESLVFLRDSDSGIDRLISDEEDLIAERTLQKEEERKSQQLYEEEAKLQQQIDELQSAELEVEVETDGETQIGTEEEEEEELLGVDESRDTDVDDTMSLEARYENMLEDRIWQERSERIVKYEEVSTRGLTWAERMDTLEQLEALVARHPGRALQLHQKLSSPSRSRAITLPETLRRFQARQEKAQQKRERLLQLKSQKLRDLLNKVGEVKEAQAQLTEDRRLRLENKLKRAEENRNLHLQSIKRKAHDEEEKLKEIAFINELEAQNKRHDFLALRQEQEERLQGIAEERQRRQEEKAAKEAAVEERKKVLEAERILKLEEMQARRKRRVERIHREQQEKEKERLEAAREKARDREERLSALHAAQLATQEELQKKIQQKQEDSARRHEENIEHIRQRALESAALRYADDAAPALEPYLNKKLCTLCNVLIGSEVYLLSHLRGKSHQEALRKSSGGRNSSAKENLDHIIEAPPDCVDEKQERHRERQRSLRKRAKKLRLRMTAKGQEYENSLGGSKGTLQGTSPNGTRVQKCLRDIEKLCNSQGLGQWSNNAVTLLERALAELNRILDKKAEADQSAFCSLNGFSSICNVLSLGLSVPEGMAAYLPSKCFVTAGTTLSLACQDHSANSEHVLLSNRILTVLDLLMCRLKEVVPDEEETSLTLNGAGLPGDAVAVSLMRLLSLLLGFAKDGAAAVRARDVVSYTVCGGAVDRLALVCGAVRDPLPPSASSSSMSPSSPSSQSAFLLAALELLSALTARCGGVGRPDPSGLGATLRSTELVGAVSMLYGLLLQQGGAPRVPDAVAPALAAPTACIARATIALLVRVAELDLAMFQSILGAEGISLQLRHISAHLLWVCSGQLRELRDLLHLVIGVLGYFTARNHDNQLVLQSGVQPTVLQQLCQLPFPYFSEPRLSAVLFPTLLACCSDNAENRAILEQELSYELLEAFRTSPAADGNRLLALMSKTKNRASSVSSKTSPATPLPLTSSSSSSSVMGPDAKKARTSLAEDEVEAPAVEAYLQMIADPETGKQKGTKKDPGASRKDSAPDARGASGDGKAAGGQEAVEQEATGGDESAGSGDKASSASSQGGCSTAQDVGGTKEPPSKKQKKSERKRPSTLTSTPAVAEKEKVAIEREA